MTTGMALHQFRSLSPDKSGTALRSRWIRSLISSVLVARSNAQSIASKVRSPKHGLWSIATSPRAALR